MIAPPTETAKNGASIEQIRGVAAMRCEPPAPTRTGPPAPDPAWAEALRLVDSRAAAGVNPDLDRAALAIIRAKLAEIEGRTGRGFDVLSTADIFGPLAPRVHPIRGLAMTAGPPCLFLSFSYGGKSVVLQDLMLSLATGTRVWGNFRPAVGELEVDQDPRAWDAREVGVQVIHLDYEQGEETKERYQRLARGRRLDVPALVASGRLSLVSLPPVYLNSPDAEEVYKRALDGRKLCFLDTFAASLPGVEENESAIGEHLYRLGRVSSTTGCVVVVAHHMGKASMTKDGQKADPRTLARGSTAIVAAAGYVYAMGGGKNEPKLVQQAKARGLGDPQVEDFYLELDAVDVREPDPLTGYPGFFNPENPADPGGFTVRYRTHEQVHPPKPATDQDLEEDVAKVLAYVAEETAHGRPVADKGAAAKGAKLRKADAVIAFKTLEARGLVVDQGKRGHSRFFAAAPSSGAPSSKRSTP